MRVTLNTDSSYKQNFGMALFMDPKEKTAKKLGSYPAEQIEFARHSLENLADDVDIKVSTFKNKDPKLCGVTIKITKVIDNPLKKMFYMGKQPTAEIKLGEIGCLSNLPDCILRKTRSLKKDFIRYV